MTYVYALAVLSLLGGALAAMLVIADRLLATYGPCRIAVNDEEPFVVEGGQTLLDGLYRQRIFIPSACGGQGTCGFCKVTVLAGGGPVLPTEWPHLTPAEIARHTRLACQVKVRQDTIVRVRADYLNIEQFQATVLAARMLTHDTRELLLGLTEPGQIDFRPGQYVQVQVPGGGEPAYRAYSISSTPDDRGRIELIVRLVPGGLGSTYLHEVQPGEPVTFTGPYGDFVLAEDAETEIVCVAGGCGLAPMKSIIHHVHKRWPARRCTLFFGARTSRDVLYLQEFERLARRWPGLRVYYALSEPEKGADWTGETGLIHRVVDKHLAETGSRQVFLCGPEPMVEAARDVLQAKNIGEDRIFYDKF